MKLFFARFRETKYIHLNTRQCAGCWDCVEACPQQVLTAGGGPRRHVRISNAKACNGCKKCVRACETGAIEYIYVPKSQAAGSERECPTARG